MTSAIITMELALTMVRFAVQGVVVHVVEKDVVNDPEERKIVVLNG